MIKNIIFDLGGVLIDWNPKYLFQDVFDNDNEMADFLDTVCSMSWNVQQDKGRSWKSGIIEKQKEFPQYRDEIALYFDKWEKMLGGVFSNNVDLLYKLKINYRLIALTNWSAETFPIAQEKYEFLNEFEGIVVSGYEKLIKPDKRFYQLMLSRYHLEAHECLFIDDNLNNIETADSLGFDTIHFKEHIDLESELIKKSIIID